MSQVSELRERVQRAVDATSVRDVAVAADVSHETVYALLRGAGVSKATARKLSDSLKSAERPTRGVGKDVAGVHAPSFWQGRMVTVLEMIEAAGREVRGLVESEVLLQGAGTPAPVPVPAVPPAVTLSGPTSPEAAPPTTYPPYAAPSQEMIDLEHARTEAMRAWMYQTGAMPPGIPRVVTREEVAQRTARRPARRRAAAGG